MIQAAVDANWLEGPTEVHDSQHKVSPEISRWHWSQGWQLLLVHSVLFAQQHYLADSKSDLRGWREHLLLEWRECSQCGAIRVDSNVLCSPDQPGSGIFFLLERMSSFRTAGHKPAHNYLWLENFSLGQAAAQRIRFEASVNNCFQ